MSFSLLNFYPWRFSSRREESASTTDWLAVLLDFKQDFKRAKPLEAKLLESKPLEFKLLEAICALT